MSTVPDKNERLRLKHLEIALEGFKVLLDQQLAEREKAQGLIRRAELGLLLGIPAATMPISQRDFESAVDRRVREALRIRARHVWWRRLVRWLRQERYISGTRELAEWWAR